MLREEWRSMVDGFLWYFILPSVVGYVENVIINLQTANEFSFQVLVPSIYTVIGMLALLKAQLVSLLKKFVPQNVVITVIPDNPPQNPLQELTDPNPTVIDTTLLDK
jgi:hypothetical protein